MTRFALGVLALGFAWGASDPDQQFVDAARKGKGDTLVRLLKDGANVNARDKKGKSAAQLAFDNGHEDISALLIMRGADVSEARGEYANFALAWLLLDKNPARAAPLRARGASAESAHGHSVLWMAAEKGAMSLLVSSLDLGVDVNARENAVRVRLDKAFGAALWIPQLVPEGPDALIKAVKNNHPEVVAKLIDRGANVNRAFISQNGKIPCVKMTDGRWRVTCNAFPAGYGYEPSMEIVRTPLCLAAEMGHRDIVKLLLERGANPNPQPAVCSAAGLAEQSGHADIVELIAGIAK